MKFVMIILSERWSAEGKNRSKSKKDDFLFKHQPIHERFTQVLIYNLYMSFRFKQRFFLLLAVLLSACASDPLSMKGTETLHREELEAGAFRLTTLSRMTLPNAPVVIYIEGDGHAWINRSTPSSDPTPRKAVGLQLALLDASPNVVYLARPCQFTANDPHCEPDYWTHKRFSPAVVQSMNEAIDHFVPPGQGVHLVGYSGGGAIAVLITVQRSDVLSLRTIAGNLDTEGLNAFHQVSPMPESLNPVDFAYRTRLIPQIHWYGEKDDVVPAFVAKNYVQSIGKRSCALIFEAKDASHEKGWTDVWQKALRMKWPPCF